MRKRIYRKCTFNYFVIIKEDDGSEREKKTEHEQSIHWNVLKYRNHFICFIVQHIRAQDSSIIYIYIYSLDLSS